MKAEHKGYTVVNRGVMGRPGPAHVRELMPPARRPNPTGDGRDAPLQDFTGRRRNDEPISESEIAYRRNRRRVERDKAARARAKREGR